MSKLFFLCIVFAVFLSINPSFAQEFKMRSGPVTLNYNQVTGVGTGLGHFYIQEINNAGIPTSVQGWSMGVAMDTSLVVVDSIDVAGYLLTVNGGTQPGFFAAEIHDDGYTVGTVYSFLGLGNCVYEVEKLVLDIHYSTLAASFIGNETGAVVYPSFSDQLGVPPVQIAMVIAGAPVPLTELVNGDITIIPGTEFIRGDVNGDGSINALSDGISLLSYLFSSESIHCQDAADVNNSSSIDLGDAIYLLSWGFTGGPVPASPFPACGYDSGVDLLDCELSGC